MSGNDDCGQMSAWYVFSAMGFYPFNPCGGEYIIGAPQVPEVRIRLGERNRPLWVGATHGEATKPSEASAEGTGNGEREFRVVARNLSRDNKYVKSVTLNGKPITNWKLRHSDIMAGGELVFEMYSGAAGK